MTPTIADIEAKYQSAFCEQLLDSPLVESDSHDKPEEGGFSAPYMTKDQTFYFVPDYTNPVRQKRRGLTLADVEPTEMPIIPGRFHYTVEVVKVYPGNNDFPEERDLDPIGDSFESLNDAIEFAAHQLLDWKIRNIGENLYWQKEAEMAPIIRESMKDI